MYYTMRNKKRTNGQRAWTKKNPQPDIEHKSLHLLCLHTRVCLCLIWVLLCVFVCWPEVTFIYAYFVRIFGSACTAWPKMRPVISRRPARVNAPRLSTESTKEIEVLVNHVWRQRARATNSDNTHAIYFFRWVSTRTHNTRTRNTDGHDPKKIRTGLMMVWPHHQHIIKLVSLLRWSRGF